MASGACLPPCLPGRHGPGVCTAAGRAHTCRKEQRLALSDPGREKPMTYDLLIRNGRIVDGSGMSAFRGDVAVKDGKIAEIGKLSGAATRTVDAQGQVV